MVYNSLSLYMYIYPSHFLLRSHTCTVVAPEEYTIGDFLLSFGVHPLRRGIYCKSLPMKSSGVSRILARDKQVAPTPKRWSNSLCVCPGRKKFSVTESNLLLDTNKAAHFNSTWFLFSRMQLSAKITKFLDQTQRALGVQVN